MLSTYEKDRATFVRPKATESYQLLGMTKEFERVWCARGERHRVLFIFDDELKQKPQRHRFSSRNAIFSDRYGPLRNARQAALKRPFVTKNRATIVRLKLPKATRSSSCFEVIRG